MIVQLFLCFCIPPGSKPALLYIYLIYTFKISIFVYFKFKFNYYIHFLFEKQAFNGLSKIIGTQKKIKYFFLYKPEKKIMKDM